MSDRANYNRNNNDHGGTLRKRTFTAAEKVAPSSSPIVAPVEVMINSAVGNIICGLLRKWVNCGKGWRTRWFVLQEDVLSYYKVHGPDKILINQEAEKESKVIGVKSLRKISQQHRHSSSSDSDLSPQVRRKPFGEIHLKVCSIRESRSDDRKFSIFTGTKKLKLRAETGEDRVAWIQALQALKEMFLSPPISGELTPPISGELTPPIETVITISTEKLRQRLAEEGVSEAGIEDCEQIMKSELGALQHHLALLKQKHGHLINALQRLQVSAIPIRTLAL